MTPNKISGGFSAGTWGTDKKVILMNFSGDLRSVMILAHEMGHSMHTLHIHTSNDYQHSSYQLFIAEVASIFCEMLLIEHVLETESGDTVKFKFLEEFIDNFNNTVFTQLKNSEYEYEIVKKIHGKSPPSDFSSLMEIYKRVCRPYQVNSHDSGVYGDLPYTSAISVPHYYMNFYLYRYAIGMLCALNLLHQIKNDEKKGVANYLRFIKSGTQHWPLDILKSAGIDLSDNSSLGASFKLYADYVDRYKKLGKKLIKHKSIP